MNSLRKWLYKPKRDDKSLLAQFFYADEELNIVAAELDSFDGRKDPERCTSLVNHLRQCQDKVLNICNLIMDEVICGERANRDFRVKFPDDVLQENLAGQLWFGAECLAAGSSIMNREVESASMRPLAKALTKSLENVRNLLRDQCFKNPPEFTEKIRESLKIFDRLFAEFELSYVSAMVPVKTMKEYDIQQSVIVLFSETLQRALKMELLTQEMVDDYDPALMFTIPRLAIVCGLLIYPDGPLSVDQDPIEMSEMFRPFRTLLFKIRELLWTLSKAELYALEKALCSMEEPKDYKKTGEGNKEGQNSSSSMLENYPIPDLDDFVDKFYTDYPSCKQFIRDFYPANFPCHMRVARRGMSTLSEDNVRLANESVYLEDVVDPVDEDDDERTPTVELVEYTFVSDTDNGDSEPRRQYRSESETHEELLAERAMMAVQESLVSVLGERSALTNRGPGGSSSSPRRQQSQVRYLRSISCSCGSNRRDTSGSDGGSDVDGSEPVGDADSNEATLDDALSDVSDRTFPERSGTGGSCDVCRRFQAFHMHNPQSFTECRTGVPDDAAPYAYSETRAPSSDTNKQRARRPTGAPSREDINQNTQGMELFGSPKLHKDQLSVPLEVPPLHGAHDQDNSSMSSACSSCRSMSTAASEDCHSECSSSDTSSYNSDCQDDEEIALAMQAAEIATRNEARSKFKNSEDLIHRLFVCVSGVADQLQTNYASDLRNILKCVFAINATPGPDIPPPSSSPPPTDGDTLLQQLDAEDRSSESPTGSVDHAEDVLSAEGEQDGVEQPPPWVPDALAPHCMGCRANFTMVRRRHHCRNCGKVFCARCSSNSVPLPHYGHLKPVRVCNRCFMYQVTPFTIEQAARS